MTARLVTVAAGPPSARWPRPPCWCARMAMLRGRRRRSHPEPTNRTNCAGVSRGGSSREPLLRTDLVPMLLGVLTESEEAVTANLDQ